MQIIYTALVIFICCTLSLFFLRPIAVKINLVDVPCERKSHNGHIPLVGGISMLLGIWLIYLLMPDILPFQNEYTLLVSIFVLIGLIDDKLDISAASRLIVTSFLAMWLVNVEGLALSYLGNLFGLGDVFLGGWSTLFTVCAVIGCVTAFNMIDGIDGLLGALATVSVGSLGFVFWLSGAYSISIFCLLLIVSILPYVCFNLGLNVKAKYKVFMGDSGSFLVGFTIIWLLVFATQKIDNLLETTVAMNPVTALWIIALPLMDMALVVLRRVAKKKSPFSADRTHIHHVALSAGLTAKQALAVISTLSLLLAGLGLILDISGVREVYSFYLFLSVFSFYAMSVLYVQALQKTRVQAVGV